MGRKRVLKRYSARHTRQKINTNHSKRGRKPIFSKEQKRVMNRLFKNLLKEHMRSLVRSL